MAPGSLPGFGGSERDDRRPGQIVAIHQKAFSHFFLTRIGARFLRLYYELVLHYQAGIVLVSECQGVLNGFVCGFANPAEFYRLMWRNRRAFALPAFAALLRHPSLAANVDARRPPDSDRCRAGAAPVV